MFTRVPKIPRVSADPLSFELLHMYVRPGLQKLPTEEGGRSKIQKGEKVKIQEMVGEMGGALGIPAHRYVYPGAATRQQPSPKMGFRCVDALPVCGRPW